MSDFGDIFGTDWDAAREASAKDEGVYRPLEPGWYRMRVEAPRDGAMIRDSRAGGKYLKCVFRVETGQPFENRLVYHNINIVVMPKDESESARAKAATAERIGRRELAQLCVACGRPMARDSAELLDCEVMVRVAVARNSKGEPENEAREFKAAAAGGASPAPTPEPAPKPAAQPAPAPAAAAGKLPWQI